MRLGRKDARKNGRRVRPDTLPVNKRREQLPAMTWRGEAYIVQSNSARLACPTGGTMILICCPDDRQIHAIVLSGYEPVPLLAPFLNIAP